MGLVSNNAVGDMDARIFKLSRPQNVARLIKARSQFNQHCYLLAALSGADETGNEWAVTRRAIQALFDANNLGVGCRILNELLHRAFERLVGVMQQNVASANGCEDVCMIIIQASGRECCHARPVQISNVGVSNFVQGPVVHQAFGFVNIIGIHLQFFHQELQDSRIGTGSNFQANHARKAPLLEQMLRGFQKIFGVFTVALNLCIAGNAESKNLQNLHARKEIIKVVLNDVLHGNEIVAVLKSVQARWNLRDFDARKQLFTLTRAAQHDSKRNTHVADEREAVAGINRQWRENREHAASKPRFGFCALCLTEILPAQDPNAMWDERGHDAIAQDDRLSMRERCDPGANPVELLHRGERLGDRSGDAGFNLPLQDADALHKEFVEIC